MSDNSEIQVINQFRNYFVRNKNHNQLLAILKENRERIIYLNTRHNIIEIQYFTGEYHRRSTANKVWEKTDIDWFGVSYEILDVMFDKYKNDKTALIKLAKFCMHSKSKTYWLKLKNTSVAQEIMAAILGSTDEEA